jgi:hypothetical protein
VGLPAAERQGGPPLLRRSCRRHLRHPPAKLHLCVHCSANCPSASCRCLRCRYLDGRSDAQLQRLRQLVHSPVAWFRSPLVQVILVSCLEYEDYKRDLRLRLKAMADTETAAPGQPELLFVYLRPAAADAAAKGPARVFDTMRRDLTRRRERCVRLDPDPDAGARCARCACCLCSMLRACVPVCCGMCRLLWLLVAPAAAGSGCCGVGHTLPAAAMCHVPCASTRGLF